MPKVMSFDDNNVGRGSGDYFKITGTKTSPQRVAYIPAEIFEADLTITEALREKAKAGDVEAREKIEEITALKENIGKSLKKAPPSAEVWTNENGQNVILFAKTEVAEVFWIDNVGYVYDIPGLPDEYKGRGVGQNYGFVIIEYELNEDKEVRILPEDSQIDLGGGHKLRFRYTMKIANLNDPKVREWKVNAKNFPLTMFDYECFTEKQGNSEKAKFNATPTCFWRENPAVKQKIIIEARKMYPSVRKQLAKTLTADEVMEMFPEITSKHKGTPPPGSSQSQMANTEVDFATLLGQSATDTPKDQPKDQPKEQEAAATT